MIRDEDLKASSHWDVNLKYRMLCQIFCYVTFSQYPAEWSDIPSLLNLTQNIRDNQFYRKLAPTPSPVHFLKELCFEKAADMPAQIGFFYFLMKLQLWTNHVELLFLCKSESKLKSILLRV